MVKVGVPHWVWPELLAKFSREVSIEIIPAKPAVPVEAEFWVAPLYPGDAQAVAPHLRGVRVVHSLLAGVDWLRPLVPNGATLCDAQSVHNVATAEWVVTVVLASLKFLPTYYDLQRAGKWIKRAEASDYYKSIYRLERDFLPAVMGEELYGKTVLIVGYGSIGQSIEERLAPFGVNILRAARSARPGVEPVSRLPELLPMADIVVLIVPLTPETRSMIGATEISRMKQGALLVNAARGPVVEADALLNALNDGRIRAAVDVTDPEPLPEGHPLWKAPNLLITPHVGGSSPLFMQRAFDFVAGQVERYARGEPLKNVVMGDY